jgi:hypothetical protein
MRYFLFLMPFLCFFSCKKTNLTDVDSIRFGHSNFAWGHICEFYELTPNGLFTTSVPCDSVMRGVPIVYDLQLSEDKFDKAKGLLTEISECFWDEGDFLSTLNCCADCCGNSIIIKRGNKTRKASWTNVFCEEDDLGKETKKLIEKTDEVIFILR